MATQANKDMLETLLQRIDTGQLALDVFAGQHIIESVLNVLIEHRKATSDLDKARSDIPGDATLNNIDIKKLASTNNTTEDAIRRVLSGIRESLRQAANAGSFAYSAPAPSPFQLITNQDDNPQETSSRNKPKTKMLAMDSVIPHLSTVDWPEALPEHARSLLTHLTQVMKKSNKPDDRTALVSLSDLETLQQGVEYLGIKIYVLANNLVRNMPRVDQLQYKGEAWYMEQFTGYDEEKEVMIADRLPTKKKHKGKRRSKKTKEEMKWEEMEGMEMEEAVKSAKEGTKSVDMPYPQDVDGAVSRPISTPSASAASALDSLLPFRTPEGKLIAPIRTSPSKNVRSGSNVAAVPFELNPPYRARGKGKSKDNSKKHSAASISSNRPTKKPKLTKPNRRPKHALSAFHIWVMVARPAVKALHPSAGKATWEALISLNWKALSIDEKVPFFDLSSEDQSRYNREIQMLRDTDTIVNENKTEKDRKDYLRNEAAKVFAGLQYTSLDDVAQHQGHLSANTEKLGEDEGEIVDAGGDEMPMDVDGKGAEPGGVVP